MNLTELASFVCEQCGMTAEEDLSAAKLFIQRRLQMIWNSQLWRAALVEASFTVSPDGTSTLADSVWIPSRGTLLLPAEIQTVLGVRTSGHALNVASLESYFRTDADLLAMQGDPAEFQVLRPAVWEFDELTDVTVAPAGSGDGALSMTVVTSADGVSQTKHQVGLGAAVSIPGVLQIFSATKPVTGGAVMIKIAGPSSPAVTLTFNSMQEGSVGFFTVLVNMSWSGDLTGYDGVKLYSSVDAGSNWLFRGLLSIPGIMEDTDGMPAGVTVWYRARAENGDGSVAGDWSETLAVASP